MLEDKIRWYDYILVHYLDKEFVLVYLLNSFI